MAEEANIDLPTAPEEKELPENVKQELEVMTDTERAAVIMLLLGEQQAADIIKFLSPREVQALGASMVGVADLSQETVNVVLDDFVATIKNRQILALVLSTTWRACSNVRLVTRRRLLFLVGSCRVHPARGWKFCAGWTRDRLAR